jgi:hypothetical protein
METVMNGHEIPYLNLLSEGDQDVYRRISSALSAPSIRNKRNTRIDSFEEIIDAIELFENSDDDDKWKRCLVCGFVRLTDAIAVNTNQLRRLVFKCRSSINGSLKGLGYDLIGSRPESLEELLQRIPALRLNTCELKQWTIRARSNRPKQETDDITPPPACAYYPDGLEIGMGGQPEGTTGGWSSGADSTWNCDCSEFMFGF